MAMADEKPIWEGDVSNTRYRAFLDGRAEWCRDGEWIALHETTMPTIRLFAMKALAAQRDEIYAELVSKREAHEQCYLGWSACIKERDALHELLAKLVGAVRNGFLHVVPEHVAYVRELIVRVETLVAKGGDNG